MGRGGALPKDEGGETGGIQKWWRVMEDFILTAEQIIGV